MTLCSHLQGNDYFGQQQSPAKPVLAGTMGLLIIKRIKRMVTNQQH